MTCKDCIHERVCEKLCPRGLLPYQSSEYPAELFCLEFKSRSDVAEVKHGEWIYHECVSSYDGAKSGYSCSVCSAFVNDEVFESDGFHKDFCGHCGADMRGGSQ